MQLFEIFLKCFTAVGVIAAIYNIISGRKIVQEQGQKAKIEQALAMGLENKQEIKHLKEQMELRAETTKERLDQIGEDIGFVKDLLVKWLLDPTRKT
jgi:lipid A disaccharide synthetase